ncbi:Uncharacterised protein [Mycobacteroides abscessus subsp. abscessus]|nr:Uncharacterised protein [Mycobacteroides abscessus subsp. abscessus]
MAKCPTWPSSVGRWGTSPAAASKQGNSRAWFLGGSGDDGGLHQDQVVAEADGPKYPPLHQV